MNRVFVFGGSRKEWCDLWFKIYGIIAELSDVVIIHEHPITGEKTRYTYIEDLEYQFPKEGDYKIAPMMGKHASSTMVECGIFMAKRHGTNFGAMTEEQAEQWFDCSFDLAAIELAKTRIFKEIGT